MFLADFGFGKVMTVACAMGTATKLAGTPGFQSPEQLKGEKMSTLSDVYSLGAVMTELFGGKPIWSNMSSHTIIVKVAIQGEMSHLPTKVKSIAASCLCPLESRASAALVLKFVMDL